MVSFLLKLSRLTSPSKLVEIEIVLNWFVIEANAIGLFVKESITTKFWPIKLNEIIKKSNQEKGFNIIWFRPRIQSKTKPIYLTRDSTMSKYKNKSFGTSTFLVLSLLWPNRTKTRSNSGITTMYCPRIPLA
mgnify:CR=1 FL=1